MAGGNWCATSLYVLDLTFDFGSGVGISDAIFFWFVHVGHTKAK